MDAKILLIADYAAVDAVGKLTVVGAFNRIFVQGLPAVHPAMYLTIRFIAELGEFEQKRILKVVFYDEDGNERWVSPNIQFAVPKPEGGGIGEYTPIIALQQMKFEKLGRHEFRVFVNDDFKGTIPLDIVMMPQNDV